MDTLDSDDCWNYMAMKQDGDAKNGCHKAFCNECCAEINTATIYDFLAESNDDVPLAVHHHMWLLQNTLSAETEAGKEIETKTKIEAGNSEMNKTEAKILTEIDTE